MMNMEGNEFFKKKFHRLLTDCCKTFLRSRCMILMFHFAANQIPVQIVAKAPVKQDITL